MCSLPTFACASVSKENLSRLADALEELEAGFRADPVRYPDGFRPPGGIDWRTFRSQVWVTSRRPTEISTSS